MFEKLGTGNALTLLAMVCSFVVFLMRYEARISKIENNAEEQQHRIEREEALIREMFPKLERVSTNLEWLVKQEKEKNP